MIYVCMKIIIRFSRDRPSAVTDRINRSAAAFAHSCHGNKLDIRHSKNIALAYKYKL